jgi:WD40 repeat protein
VHLGTTDRRDIRMAPYTAMWTSAPLPHQGVMSPPQRSGVWSLCSVTVAGRDLLASGGGDGTVWLWDPATGEPASVLEGRGKVHSVCSVTVANRELLAAGHDDGTVRVWDPATGELAAAYEERRRELPPRVPVPGPSGPEPVIVLQSSGRAVRSVCPVTVAGRNLLAAGSDDMTVRVWDPATGEQVAVLDRAAQGYWGGGFDAVCPVTLNGRDLLGAGDDDGTVQVWDPATGEQVAVLNGHRGGVRSVCPFTVASRTLLASGSWDGTLLVWTPDTGEVIQLGGHWHGVQSVSPISVAGRSLLASGGEENMVRVWEPATGALLDTIPTSSRVLAIHEVARLLAIGQDFGVQVGELNLST